LVSALWGAADHSLPAIDVLEKVWGDRPASINEKKIHKLRQCASGAGNSLEEIGITIAVTKDRLGYISVWLELP